MRDDSKLGIDRDGHCRRLSVRRHSNGCFWPRARKAVVRDDWSATGNIGLGWGSPFYAPPSSRRSAACRQAESRRALQRVLRIEASQGKVSVAESKGGHQEPTSWVALLSPGQKQLPPVVFA